MFFDRVDKGFSKSMFDQEQEIELNKQFAKTMAKVRASLKTGTCYCCGKPITSYCNSHSIPRYCLENIGTNGEVSSPNAIYGLPRMGQVIGKETPGINESGVFYLICRECDSTVFKEYEDPTHYTPGAEPTQVMLAQIAMKNYLKFIYKRKIEIELMESTLGRDHVHPLVIKEFSAKLEVSKIDLDTYSDSFALAKKYMETGKGPGYFLFYYRLLDYVAPIAIQVPLVVSIDLEGNVVNDLYNPDPDYKLSDLHVCVSPQKATTAIMLFTDAGEKRYRKFRKQFSKLSDTEKLGVINYIIFLYSEDYYMAREIQDKIDLQSLNRVANITPVIWSTTQYRDTRQVANTFSLANWKCIPNLLSEEYKLR